MELLIALCWAALFLTGTYAIYQCFFHPLSHFPGPFLGKLTDLWKLNTHRTGSMPALLCDLHVKYGNVVRIGPNELSFDSVKAVEDIYKMGRAMEKGPLYDGFTAFRPNIFGLRNEDVR